MAILLTRAHVLRSNASVLGKKSCGLLVFNTTAEGSMFIELKYSRTRLYNPRIYHPYIPYILILAIFGRNRMFT